MRYSNDYQIRRDSISTYNGPNHFHRNHSQDKSVQKIESVPDNNREIACWEYLDSMSINNRNYIFAYGIVQNENTTKTKNDNHIDVEIIQIDPYNHQYRVVGEVQVDIEPSNKITAITTERKSNPSPSNDTINEALKKDWKRTLSLIPEEKRSELAIIQELKSLGIDFPERFNSYEEVLEIIKNRKNNDPDDTRPVALFFYPKVDENDALIQENKNKMSEFMKNGYKVVYAEGASEDDFYDTLKDIGGKKKIDTLVLAGHGNKKLLSLGADDPRLTPMDNERSYIDISDEREMKNMSLNNYMTDNSNVILLSCSTGEGGAQADNLANVIKDVFNQSTITSAHAPINDIEVSFDKNGQLKTASLYDIERMDEDVTYRVA